MGDDIGPGGWDERGPDRLSRATPGPADDWDRGLVPNETTVIEPAVDSGREPAGRVTHVGVQLPDEAAEVVVREMHREDLPGELLHIVDGERLAILGPGDDVLEARILYDSVPASRARSGRVSAREVGRDDAMALAGSPGSFFSIHTNAERWDSHFARELGPI